MAFLPAAKNEVAKVSGWHDVWRVLSSFRSVLAARGGTSFKLWGYKMGVCYVLFSLSKPGGLRITCKRCASPFRKAFDAIIGNRAKCSCHCASSSTSNLFPWLLIRKMRQWDGRWSAEPGGVFPARCHGFLSVCPVHRMGITWNFQSFYILMLRKKTVRFILFIYQL